MDVLCCPSQTTRRWREQFGRVLTEGFACGIPVVASDSGEIPLVVGDAGIIVGEHDLPGWIAALARLLNTTEQRRHYSQLAIQRAHSKFRWDVVARQHLEFFEEVLSSRGRGI
jgi:glycosyltransferase involved in cell wall biosynthesis